MLHSLMFNFKISHFLLLKVIFFWLTCFTWLLILVQFMQFHKNDLMAIYKSNALLKAVFYVICFYSIMIYGVADAKEFIYFQF